MQHKSYKGYRWLTLRDATLYVAILATVIAVFCAMSALDKQEAAKLAEKEVAQQIEVKPVMSVQIEEKPVSDPEPVATPEPVMIYDVPLDADLQLFIVCECEKVNIDPAVIVAMTFCESSYNTNAIGDNGNSFGLLQVQPRWHQERMDKLGCTDLLDPYQNVIVALDYLAELINRDKGLEWALAAYNAGAKGANNGFGRDYAQYVLDYAEVIRETQTVIL